MPPRKHAILSASASHRWLHCNPSARLEQEFEDQETEAAKEGIAAHALCEHKLRRALKMQSKKPISPYDCEWSAPRNWSKNEVSKTRIS